MQKSALSPLVGLRSGKSVVAVSLQQLRANMRSAAAQARANGPPSRLQDAEGSAKKESTPTSFPGNVSKVKTGSMMCENVLDWLQDTEGSSKGESTLTSSPGNVSMGKRGHMICADLLGCWTDNVGNFVVVGFTNTPDGKLSAMLTKPWAENILLSLWCAEKTGKWHCGSAVLHQEASSRDRLVWVFPGGRQVVWTWMAFTLEALKARGFALADGTASIEEESSVSSEA
eukprot:CAMPEP_0115232524 /NCGR_PEP_ID=MMETSP0270-20121206/33811_1 /TAXON_ID=71861 /ORGANISM="Scrippsiella trochoidea, Strain CCMP3099" /LENGTH=228 /DNA_ID=CAMNT_0002647221 /DNA_START=98 /DNA_END=784 /DNA_ORIENTATION=+